MVIMDMDNISTFQWIISNIFSLLIIFGLLMAVVLQYERIRLHYSYEKKSNEYKVPLVEYFLLILFLIVLIGSLVLELRFLFMIF